MVKNNQYAMPTLNVYLHFKGNCERAFDFYKSVFGGEYEFIGRYKDIPQKDRQHFPYCAGEQIMHVTLPISRETILMGSDLVNLDEEEAETRSGFSLYLNTDNRKEAGRIFEALSGEGDIIVPIADQFWGSYYGQCVDKFGISWKVSCSQK
jgi:PhnB protein